ncbi:unnamed protein product [Blepharisma stoltei]|uniref:Uncharacterized protein n=1 Tax=Blepharisma stoltei TaxID=1481888 RepID=A0AAU9IEK5_9CILI|nr:unnamed protein product [Blepharisma stoltei]
MERSQAINKQLGHSKHWYMATPSLSDFIWPWCLISLLGASSGTYFTYAYGITPKEWIDRENLRFWTGPSFYMNYCLVWFWIYKVVSMIQILKKETTWESYRVCVIRDIFTTFAFWATYNIFEWISKRLLTFTISGHSFVLVVISSMILFEAETNYRLTYNELMIYIGKGVIAYNYYIFFWTCFAFHTLSHTVMGLVVGFTITYFVYFRMDKIRIT